MRADHIAPDWTGRLVVGKHPDRRFDIEFWQKQGDEAIFSTAWEMIELAEEMKHGRKQRVTRTVKGGHLIFVTPPLRSRLGNALILQSRARKQAVTPRFGSDLKRCPSCRS